MNNRERFRNLMTFKPVHRVPIILAQIWPDTMTRWLHEGYPVGVEPEEYFQVEPFRTAYIGPHGGLYPEPEEKIIDQTETTIIKTDTMGRTIRDFKDHTSMPEWIDFPAKTPAGLEHIIKEHFDPAYMEERWPDDWRETAEQYASDAGRDTILFVNGGQYYGTLRNLAGVEYASLLFYDAPELVDELLERINKICLAGIQRAMEAVEIDYVGFGEDIAFKTSSLISPDMFSRFIQPRYAKVMALANNYGEHITWLDTDGNFWSLIDMFMSAGVNGFGPLEVAAGMDPVELRSRYGKDIRMFGGVDKREIARGPAAIDAQLERLAPVIAEGGYIPYIDHSVSADISLANYTYFIKALKQACGW